MAAQSRLTWSELPPTARRVILGASAVDTALRAWALVDLLRRDQDRLNGRKAYWMVALATVNSAGALPLAYLVRGRRRLVG